MLVKLSNLVSNRLFNAASIEGNRCKANLFIY